jgi:hypothetical protein
LKPFTRLSFRYSKRLECLEAACALFLAYYNFVWRTRYPDDSGRPGKPAQGNAGGDRGPLWKNFGYLVWGVGCLHVPGIFGYLAVT